MKIHGIELEKITAGKLLLITIVSAPGIVVLYLLLGKGLVTAEAFQVMASFVISGAIAAAIGLNPYKFGKMAIVASLYIILAVYLVIVFIGKISGWMV